MAFAPTDAIAINVELSTLNESANFDCLEVQYQAKLNGMYSLRALLCGDVVCYAFEAGRSGIQLARWAKVTVESSRFEPLCFQGQVQRVEGTTKLANGKELIWIECVPECYALFTDHRSGVYLGASALELIERGLTKRFSALGYRQTTVSKSLRQDDAFYPIQNSITQYGESDLAFIFRNLNEYGIWANLRQDYSGKGGVTLLVADHNDALNTVGEIDILTNANHEGAGIYDVTRQASGGLPDQVRAIYFSESQNQYVMKTAEIEKVGGRLGGRLDHHCLGNLLTENQVNSIAEITRDSLALKQSSLAASFQGLAVQPGDVISVHFDGKETPYVLTEVSYAFAKGDPAKKGEAAQHSQNHTLQGACLLDAKGNALTYRAPIWVRSTPSDTDHPLSFVSNWVRAYPNHAYNGVMNGVYGMPSGEIVVPDSLGNVPVVFPYDYTEVCGTVPARYTRVISYSNQGGTTGRSFPIYKDTELQITFANGNMDYPLIKGAAANEDTGHVHNSSVQQRTHYALPQGQYLTYSNVPGDNNFMTMGASHEEGKARSFMMLSNHQDPNIPGSKKLDHQVITNKSHEQVTLGDKMVQHAGNASTLDKQQKTLPLTYVQFVIGDQTNLHKPDSAPILDDYLEAISADLQLTMQDDTERTVQNAATATQGNLHVITQLISDTTHPAIPPKVKAMTITLKHNKRNGTDETVVVNIIAQNTKPIFPTNTIHLQAKDWQQQKTTDDAGNIYYKVHLNLLAPSLLFNFRQDWYADQSKLTGEDLDLYKMAQPYFEPETYASRVLPRETLSDTELDYYQTMGQNVTIFIHGYNVGFGMWAPSYASPEQFAGKNLEAADLVVPVGASDLYQNDELMKQKFAAAYDSEAMFGVAPDKWNAKKISALVGSEAHKWLLCMEHSLNKAIGFNGQDYSKYNRLIGIAWQGNPNVVDFSAGWVNIPFAAKKVLALVEQLLERGIKVDIVAHSMGNGVLVDVLNQLGKAGKQINQAFMWEAAIPNNVFDGGDMTPLALHLRDKDNHLVKVEIPGNYPDAKNGADSFSILYSSADLILGNINAKPSQTDWSAEAIQDFWIGRFGNQPDTSIEASVAKGVVRTVSLLTDSSFGNWLSEQLPSGGDLDPTVGNIINETYNDPGAGMIFAAPAAVMFLLDNYGIAHISSELELVSIYHFAMKFVEPLDYFLEDGYNIIEFWDRWTAKFPNFILPTKDGNKVKAFYALTPAQAKFAHLSVGECITKQMHCFQNNIPEAYNLLCSGIYLALKVRSMYGSGKVTGAQVVSIIEDATELTAWVKSGNSYFEPKGDTGKFAQIMATMMLSVILTPEAAVAPALGFKGVDLKDPILKNGNIFQSPQKDPSGKDLCVDHSAMLFPTPEFMEYVYKGVLMNAQTNIKFKYFGEWRRA